MSEPPSEHLRGGGSASTALDNAYSCVHRGDTEQALDWIETARDHVEDAHAAEEAIVEELEAKLIEVLDDNRHHYDPAQVESNGPLALIQTRLAERRDVLEWVLQLLEGEDYELDHDPDVPDHLLEDES